LFTALATAAGVGSESSTVAAEIASVSVELPEEEQPTVEGEPRLVHQFAEEVLAEGHEYVVRAYASERTNGMWGAWLVFTDPLTSEMRSTGVETMQSKLADVVYWATGLEPTYLEGAFARATEVAISAPVGGLEPEPISRAGKRHRRQ